MCYEDTEIIRQVFKAFVDGSVEKNEAVQVICSSRNAYDAFMQIANLSPLARDHVQCLPMSEFSSKSGGVNHEKALSVIKSALEATSKMGFNGLRIFSLSNQYFDHISTDEVVRFEQQLGHEFTLPIAMICAYDTAKNLSDEVLLDLLRAHGSHIFQGLAG
jgi:hypothetical protein